MTELTGFKFVNTLVLELNEIKRDDKTKYATFSSKSKAEAIINESKIDDVCIFLWCYVRISEWNHTL